MCKAFKLFVLCFAVLCSCTSEPEIEICKIDETTFPDANFRNWILSQGYGKDGVLTDNEISEVEKIIVDGKGIQSLKGIEYFTALTELDCRTNELATLDLSKNTQLRTLMCGLNKLTSLDISQNTSLEVLICGGNQLTTLNLSQNTLLKTLACYANPIASLDLSNNIMLEGLACFQCKLTSLDLSKNTRLKHLTCYANQIRDAGMDALLQNLPTVSEGKLDIFAKSEYEGNIITTEQVAIAKNKGWIPRTLFIRWTEYQGSTRSTETVSYTKGQMATIILPTTPDAGKGRYYRLDRCEYGRAIFAKEPQPKARTPYIIVPKEDFGIDVSTMELDGLSRDSISVGGISFIGTYCREEMNCQEGFYIDIIDSTPDCLIDNVTQRQAIIGALRACLIVCWDDPYTQGPTKSITEKMEIILEDNTNM